MESGEGGSGKERSRAGEMTYNISVSRIVCDLLVLCVCGEFTVALGYGREQFTMETVSGIPLLLFHLYVKPYKRGFYCDDETLR